MTDSPIERRAFERNMDMGERVVKMLWALIAASFCLGGWVTALQLQVSGNSTAISQERVERKDSDEQLRVERAKTLDNWNLWREKVTGDLSEIKAMLRDKQK